MRGSLLLLFLVWALPAAGSEVEGQIEQLAEWQEAPLDLREADAQELVLLPGIDADLAEAIVALRSLGRLGAVEDLLQIPGVRPSTLDALRPYVGIGRADPPLGMTWSTLSQHREEFGARTSHRFEARGPAVQASGVFVSGPEPRWRAAIRGRSARYELLAGHLRLGPAGGILDPRPGRSRVAPAARPREGRMRPRTDSSADQGWSAVGVGHPRGFVFAARGAGGEATVGAALALRAETTALHTTIRADDLGWAASVDLVRRELAWVGLTAEGQAHSARIGMRLRGQQWRVGLDASATDAPLRIGSDSVTGHRLDRVHRCVQMHGRFRGSGWSAGALWRDLARGGSSPVATVEFEASWHGPARGWIDAISARMRTVPERRFTVLAQRVIGRREWRLRFARSATSTARSEALGAEFRVRGERQELRLTAVGVDGTASRAWMLTRPGTGIYPVWVRPPGVLLGAGVGLRAGGMRLGAWIWMRADGGRPPAPGIGIICSLEAGRMVRRLQGSAPSGTGSPARRPPDPPRGERSHGPAQRTAHGATPR